MKHVANMRLATIFAAILAIPLAFVPMSASASTATAPIAVSATVAADCSVTANSLPFGNYQGALVNAQTNITVTCTNTTPYSVGLNAGTTTGATVTKRLMANGTQTLGYGIYQDSGHTTSWGDASGSWATGTGSGAAQTLNVYGQIPAGQFPTPGSYTDSVTVTVTY